MTAETILSSRARKLLRELCSPALQQIGLQWGFKDEFEKIHNTVSAIKPVLVDAEEQQKTNRPVEDWIEKLKDGLYEADDLIDELMMMTTTTQKNTRAKKVRDFFPGSKQFGFRSKIGHEIKVIRERLDDISADMINNFNFSIREGQEEEEAMRVVENKKWVETPTLSFTGVEEVNVVGRDEDKKAIIQLVLEEDDVSMISIVGMGEIGKTTLAQLVYNDEQVKKHFERRMWVTTSYVFDVKLIVKIMAESGVGTDSEIIQMDRVEDELKKQIDGKKYFLVLDDVWEGDSNKWMTLRESLRSGGRGSKILITTRSLDVARIGGRARTYELQPLSESESWTLFKQIAFEHGVEPKNPALVTIGKKITMRCLGHPLFILTIGGLLRINNTEKEWRYFIDKVRLTEEVDLAPEMLNLSYDYLPPYLKQCFAYCSVFPSNHKINKQSLIQLWIAQGFIQSSDESKHLEDVGDQYFMHLLRCSFLEAVEKDDLGNVWSCKIPNILHQFAKYVVRSESCATGLDAEDVVSTTRHVSVSIVVDSSWEIPTRLLEANKLRTLLLRIQYRRMSESSCNNILSSFKRLRVLELDGFEIKKVPSSIGELRQLRYLDLSNNWFQLLPECICRLQNLQTLKLNHCEYLKELPSGTKNLVSMRHLELDNCWNLSHMPCGLGHLTSLHTLTQFVLGGQGMPSAGLSELKCLVNLRGGLRIERLRGSIVNKTKKEHPNNYYLIGMEFLESLILGWNKDLDGFENDNELLLFESLQPHPNLKKLEIQRYGGSSVPSWMMVNIGLSLPNLVQISLWRCHSWQHLPPFGLLPSLQVLILAHMDSLEYLYEEEEDCGKSCDYDSSSLKALGLFPSLKRLSLYHLKRLKGLGSWRRKREVVPTATATATTSSSSSVATTTASSSSSSSSSLATATTTASSSLSVAKELLLTSSLEAMRYLNSLEALYVESCPQFDLFTDDRENVMQFQSLRSLTTLSIKEMPNLVSLPARLQYVTTLQNLLIQGCEDLVTMPELIGNLTSLESLRILNCKSLTSLPDCMRGLTALQFLHIIGCPQLIKRCQKETGEDWPKIAHIPSHILR